MGVAAIHGFQGRQAAGAPIDAQHVLATAKHFTAHGTPEGGRNTAPGNYSAHVIREVFLPPFEAAVREANVATVMASYNELDGIPSHANHWLLTELLRGEWKFPGLVVSDYFGIAELERKHHVVATLPEAGRAALEAGVDLEVPQIEGFATLAADVKAGTPADRRHRPGGGARPAREVPARPVRTSLRRREPRSWSVPPIARWRAAPPTRRSCS